MGAQNQKAYLTQNWKLTVLQLCHLSPPLLPPSVTLVPVHSMPAPVCQLLYCTTLPFQVPYCEIQNDLKRIKKTNFFSLKRERELKLYSPPSFHWLKNFYGGIFTSIFILCFGIGGKKELFRVLSFFFLAFFQAPKTSLNISLATTRS